MPRADASAALRALERVAGVIAPVLLVSEIRSVAADDLWLSAAYGRDSVAIHFTWVPDAAAVASAVAAVEAALDPFDARPHWGKVFAVTASDLEGRYPKMADFRGLVQRLDPRGAFRSDFLERHVLG